MNIRNLLCIAAFCFLKLQTSCQTPFTCKGQYYLSLTKSGFNSSGLYRVKISDNGLNIYLDTISPAIGLVLNAMGYRITDNFIYGMDPNTARLRKIGSDGVAIDLGIPKDIPLDPLYYAGDVTPDGRYLLLIGLGGNTPQIVKVDLEDPQYQCSFVPMQDRTVSIVDIAFDPFTGILYGHDLRNKRMVIVNPETGAVNSNFIVQRNVDQLGALFFDSFGNLYGYGAYETLVQDKFVSINKITGQISLLAQGPLSSGQDGCACPYTLELKKTVTPEVTYPCTEVVYSFIISNGSGTVRNGIRLSDTLPEGLIIKSVLSNPFGGRFFNKNNIFYIEDLTVKVGIDTIKVLAEVGSGVLGLLRNQAVLSGLPPALGSFSLSDNPYTLIEKDSTDLLVMPLDLTFFDTLYNTCPHDSIYVDISLPGLKIKWSDGDTSPKKWLKSPGLYVMKISSLCHENEITIKVKNELLTLNILEDTIFLNLGEEIHIISEFTNADQNEIFKWESNGIEDVFCIDCQSTGAQPTHDGYYVLNMRNEIGCTVSDKVIIKVKKHRNIYAPNIFSPNDDQINDTFFLTGNALISDGLYLLVYDRWGSIVFQSDHFVLNDSSFGWDGAINGQSAVPGVYTWTAAIKYIDGFEQILKGDITVIK